MATPRVLGQLLRLTANLCLAREASVTEKLDFNIFRKDFTSLPISAGVRTQERLVSTTTTGNNADHASRPGVDDLLGTRGELDSGLALVGVVANDCDVATGSAAQGSTVTDLLLHVADNGTLGHLTQGQNVADSQGGLLSSVDELSSVHALVGDEGLGHLLELVGVAENDLGERGTSTCAHNPSLVLVP